MKKPLIVLTGPTAIGKTSLSISLAKAVNGEIISADSMQVYKHMDIGSAKIRSEEMKGIPHYLVDELYPEEEFHVVKFQQMAKKAMEQIYANGHIPIVVGGTGFYIQALLYDIDFTENAEDSAYRKELEEYYDETNTETAQNDLLSQILENSKVSGYPQDLYDKCKEEYDANNQILADMFGIDVSDIAGSEDDVKSAVEEMVYTEMLTTAIAEKENITVSDDEYTDYVNSVYEESGYTSAEEYEEDYTKDETVNTILYNKVMDFLMQNATVTEVSEDEYYEEDTEMDEEAYDTEEITENETDAEDLEMTE